MQFIEIDVSDTASGALGRIGPDAAQALRDALEPLQKRLTREVRQRVLNHLHTTGAKPGLYLASIFGGVSSKDHRVVGYVRSGNPLAHLLEAGVADTGAHDIMPKTADILKFLGDAGAVYARIVHHPGATIPAYPAFGPTLAAHRDEIEATMTGAVAAAAHAGTR